MTWLKIFYKPTSILGLLVAVGLFFLFIGGMAIPIQKEVSDFFLGWGKTLLILNRYCWLVVIYYSFSHKKLGKIINKGRPPVRKIFG
jgi:hypothetical protein